MSIVDRRRWPTFFRPTRENRVLKFSIVDGPSLWTDLPLKKNLSGLFQLVTVDGCESLVQYR